MDRPLTLQLLASLAGVFLAPVAHGINLVSIPIRAAQLEMREAVLGPVVLGTATDAVEAVVSWDGNFSSSSGDFASVGSARITITPDGSLIVAQSADVAFSSTGSVDRIEFFSNAALHSLQFDVPDYGWPQTTVVLLVSLEGTIHPESAAGLPYLLYIGFTGLGGTYHSALLDADVTGPGASATAISVSEYGSGAALLEYLAGDTVSYEMVEQLELRAAFSPVPTLGTFDMTATVRLMAVPEATAERSALVALMTLLAVASINKIRRAVAVTSSAP